MTERTERERLAAKLADAGPTEEHALEWIDEVIAIETRGLLEELEEARQQAFDRLETIRELRYMLEDRAAEIGRLNATRTRARVETLEAEAEWIEHAHRNSARRGYPESYRAGFLAAAKWVRFHAEHPDIHTSAAPPLASPDDPNASLLAPHMVHPADRHKLRDHSEPNASLPNDTITSERVTPE